MKKYLALILGVLIVLTLLEKSFAVMAEIPTETQAALAKYGIHITLGGEIRVRGWYTKNIVEASHHDKTSKDGHSEKSAAQLNAFQPEK